MTKISTRKIVIAGVMSAIAIFLGVTRLGYLPWFAGASLTIMHVPVIIGAILEGPVVSLIIGLIFGVSSLIQAALAPQGPLDPFFVNPLISILPRLFIGPLAWLAYKALKRHNQIIALILSAIAGSLTNTILVLTLLGVFAVQSVEWLTWAILATAGAVNGIPEAVAAALITLAVVSAWEKIEHGRKGSRLE